MPEEFKKQANGLDGNIDHVEETEMFGGIDIGDPNMKPLVYYGIISGFNDCILEMLGKGLNERSDFFGKHVTFITPGSTGRKEKGSMASRDEFIAITDDPNLDLDDYQQKLIGVLNEIFPRKISVVETKGPETSLVHYTGDNKNGNKDKLLPLQPGRIADGHLVYGDQKVLTDIKIKLAEQIVNLERSDIDRINSLKRDARKTTERGRNRIGGKDRIHFNLETGVVFFNPNERQLSFKIGPLRLVQNTLLVEEVKHVLSEKDLKFINNLKPSIIERLGQLSDDQMINRRPSEVKEIMEHYAFFLKLYHKSERAYQKSKQIVIQLTPGEVLEVAKHREALLGLMKELRIRRQPL